MNSIKHYPGKHEMSVFDFFRAEVNRQKDCNDDEADNAKQNNYGFIAVNLYVREVYLDYKDT